MGMSLRPLVCVVALSLLVSSCALLPADDLADTPPSSVLAKVEFAAIEGEVGVGMVVDLSGDSKSVETPIVAMVAASVDSRNEEGGILGETIGLRVLDGGNDVDVTIDAVEALIDRDVEVIIMGCEPETVIPAAQLANERGVLVMSPCITADAFAIETGALSFSAAVPDRQQGYVLADRAVSVGARTAITIEDVIDESSHSRCASFSDRFARSGGTTTATIEFGESGVPLNRVGVTLDQFTPPEVAIICATQRDVAAVVRQVRSVGAETLILLGTEADSGFWNTGPSLSGVEFVTATSLYGGRSQADDQLIGGYDPPVEASSQLLAVTLFDLFVESRIEAGEVAPDLIAGSVVDRSVDRLLLGSLTFDADHSPVWSRLGIARLDDGLVSLVARHDPFSPPAPPPTTTAFVTTTEAPNQ